MSTELISLAPSQLPDGGVLAQGPGRFLDADDAGAESLPVVALENLKISALAVDGKKRGLVWLCLDFEFGQGYERDSQDLLDGFARLRSLGRGSRVMDDR